MFGKILKKIAFLLLIVSCSIYLYSCGSKDPTDNSKLHTITVEATNNDTTLYFSGTLQPLEIFNVSSPVDGTINKIYFRYGQRVNKDDALITIDSDKLEQDYQDALTSYLQAKDNYAEKKLQMVGTEELHAAKVISEQEYEQNKSALADSYLSFMQAQRKLNVVLATARGYTDETADVANLSIEDLEKVQLALDTQFNELIIRAPTFGVVLMPPDDNSQNGSEGSDKKQIIAGTDIKQNQTLISIGDLTGLTVMINVNEVDINLVKIGQTVSVTGVAFPGITLKGEVGNIQIQAAGDISGGLPTFPVEIVIPHVKPEDRKVIHIGMSAKVELVVSHPATMVIPLNAVFNREQRPYVKLLKDNKIVEVPVTISETTVDSVVITHGLQNGDQIIAGD